MFNWFKTPQLISNEDANFHLETWKWLLKYYGGSHFFQNTQLILPTKDFFPTQVSSEEEVAEATFNSVKNHAGMQQWQCQLVEQESDPNIHITPTIQLQNTQHSPAGTFQINQNQQAIISYHPMLIQQPEKLVATFAHELSHYLTAHTLEPPYGGWDNWEFATDITATFLGFGIFMANSAFHFEQFTTADSQGWQTSRTGYLSEEEHIFSLTIFLKLLNIPFAQAQNHLKPSLKKLLKLADKQLEALGAIEKLKAIKYAPSHT